ncbi:pentatricopeptide repeat-containing protein At5g16860 isoform X2 [Amborella trichopoda]|uniref:pentatricopeptide repeat-containing protein At5g16860 isoform X2 n=1 Tax=Amborella trichopoda TaxID=13333 RepID=UPI0005D34837|nr:pentatricopeptide repeat-containing protein At5g16860 isoform X2 [Amborella trichopoda]|eukprot:XP_006852213.2 pentatricopeptide repeat-containing protein At5g16860 isoform X2 [Amborella trichopoda]
MNFSMSFSNFFHPRYNEDGTTLCDFKFPSVDIKTQEKSKLTAHIKLKTSDEFSSLLQSCTARKDLAEGKLLHAQIILNGLDPSGPLGYHLVTLYTQCGCVEDAQKVFDKMHQRINLLWTAIIACSVRNGDPKEALNVFRETQLSQFEPSEPTLSCVLRAISDLGYVKNGQEVHAFLIRNGLGTEYTFQNSVANMYISFHRLDDAEKVLAGAGKVDIIYWTSLITGYVDMGCVEKALEQFREMVEMGAELNVVSWTALISSFVKNGHGHKALELFRAMQEAGVEPNYVTIASLIAACARVGGRRWAREVHGYVLRHGLELKPVEGGALIKNYAKFWGIDEAYSLFKTLSKKDVVLWTEMIGLLMQSGLDEQALACFREMVFLNTRPDAFAITTILPACARLLALKQCKEIHGYILRYGLSSDVVVGSSLLDTYAKCGSINSARLVFNVLARRDLVSWTAMIMGYATNGFGNLAFSLFSELEENGLEPDYITFIGALIACARVGLVEEGLEVFRSMSQKYGISPGMEHYACMVDLLGRAGRLKEALSVIYSMPFEPVPVILANMLAACRLHGDHETAELVSRQMEGRGLENHSMRFKPVLSLQGW